MMKLFQENVYTDVELADNNEIVALKLIAQTAADKLGVDEQELKSGLIVREAMSTSAMGDIAMPHANVSGIENPTVLAFTFAEPIIWGEAPAHSVDTVIALIMPRNEHQEDYHDVLDSFAKHMTQPADVAAITASKQDANGLVNIVNNWLPVTVFA